MPAYNIEDTIQQTLASMKNVLLRITPDYELIVVDDGSVDRTLQRIQQVADKNLLVIKNEINQGKGAAIKAAVQVASGDCIVFHDADMDIDPEQLSHYATQLETSDVIIGSKRCPGAVYQAPFMRKILSLSFNVLVRILTGVGFADTQTGLKAFRGKALKKIIRLLLVKHYAFDVELLAIAKLLNLKVMEMPIRIKQESGFSGRAVFRMLYDLAGIAYRLRILKWYQQNLASIAPEYRPLIRRQLI